MIPRATYRLQFRKEFTFEDADAVLPYLARLGISHVYTSPILAARKGSTHGYDVVDHARINPELGGEDAFRRFAAQVKEIGLGLIVDIVPNHMATGAENAWWMDVLEYGRESPHARNFDIDWDPPDPLLKNRVLLPILAMPIGEALARRDVKLVREADNRRFAIAYADHRLPLRPEDACGLAEAGFDTYQRPEQLAALLDCQHYRLAWWRVAGDSINWRRFFDVNDLIALRVEDDRVFEQVHATHLALFAEGLIDGFRVDHMDGLADPAGYCRKLRGRLGAVSSRRAYAVVEKILAPGEELPGDWGIDGTTGYDFMNDVSALLHDPRGAEPLAKLWAKTSEWLADFEAEDRSARRRILGVEFRGAFEAAARSFRALLPSGASDMTLASLERGLARLYAELRIYRTYATGDSGAPRSGAHSIARLQTTRLPSDMSWRSSKVAPPRLRSRAASLRADSISSQHRWRRKRTRTRPTIDMVDFFRATRSVPIRPSSQYRRAHFTRARSRGCAQPLYLRLPPTTTSAARTRARLAVLSEIADRWRAAVQRWFACNAQFRDRLINRGDEYQLYQALVGSWPLDLAGGDEAGLRNYAERIAGWRVKSLREAKVRTSWGDPDQAFEEANVRFVRNLLDPHASNTFLSDVRGFILEIAPAAALNTLAQCVLRCTAPGVPDLYQGTEFWDFSLVDPDNRAPVDFAARATALARDTEPPALLADWRSGELKQAIIAQLLAARARHEECFRTGDYCPVTTKGARANHIVSFIRVCNAASILVLVPRLCAKPCIDAAKPHPPSSFWGDTILTPWLSARRWRPLFGHGALAPQTRVLRCAELFDHFPVAVLVAD